MGARTGRIRPASRSCWSTASPRTRDCGTGSLSGWSASDTRSATVDLRGHGRSSKPDAGYDVTTVAGDLAASSRASGSSGRCVVGQSWGGNVVLELAVRRPSAIRGIACVDGGWLEPRTVFADWQACRAALAPPRLVGRPLRRDRASHPVEPPRLAGDRDPGDPGELRGPSRRHDRAVADLRPPPARPARPVGSPSVRALSGARGPGPAPAGGRRRGRSAGTQAGLGRRRRGGDPARPDPLVRRRPRHPRPASRRSRRCAPCSRDRMGSWRDRSTDPDDHGLGRDGADDGQGPPGAVRAVRPRRRCGGHAHRHAVRLPGERRRAHRLGSSTSSGRASAGRWPCASYRSRAADAVETATAVARIGEGRYVLAGPGSPSYALTQWAGGPIPAASPGSCPTAASSRWRAPPR